MGSEMCIRHSCFIDTDGSQDNIIATYTFQIDLSGYTITADE